LLFHALQEFKNASERPNLPNDQQHQDGGEVDVFRPALEQIGPHLMKKCSVFIKRIAYIEVAVHGDYKSIDMRKSQVGQHFYS